MKDWFDSLAEREQIMVLTAAGFVAVAILYLGLWLPLDRGHKSAAASVEIWRLSLAELRPLRSSIQNPTTGRAPADGQKQSLVVIIDNTLRQRDLYGFLQRSQPTSEIGIRVELENVPFDDLMLWLSDLGRNHGLQVQSGNFSRGAGESQGRVTSSLTLER